MKINLSGFKPLIFFLFVLTCINVSSQTNNEVYKRYNSSNYKNIQGANNVIDFENIDYKLLNALIFFKTNEERLNHQLAPLEYLENLEMSATMHARDMVYYNFFSHTNPYLSAHANVVDRVTLSGISNAVPAKILLQTLVLNMRQVSLYTVDGEKGLFSYTVPYKIIENRTYYSLADALIIQWMNSPGHCANILNANALQMGCGVAFYRDKGFNNMAMFKAVQNFQCYEKAKI